MTRHHRNRSEDRLLNPGATSAEIRCDFACAPLDRAARAADARWGVDRLPELVPAAMAEKFGAAMAALNTAMADGDSALTAQIADNLAGRAFPAMEAAATAAGHQPLPPEIWEAEIDGNRFGIVRETFDSARAEALRPGLPIYTLREVANAMAVYRMGVIEESRKPPPATVKPTTALEKQLDDFVPY